MPAAQPRLLYVVSEDWYFLSHRLPMARAARDAGFDVHVATRVRDGAATIRAEGFTLHAIPFERGQLSLPAAAATIRALRALHRAIRPVLAHHVSLQPSVLAMVASLGRNIACVNALTGFGYTFTSNELKARAIRPAVAMLLRLLLDRDRSIALVQNPDDRETLRRLGLPDHRISSISGSGVDLETFRVTPEPAGLTVGFVGRLLADKGIHILVEAVQIVRRRGLDIRLQIAGQPDVANPSSIPIAMLDTWRQTAGLELVGQIDDVAGFWARTNIAVLPSRREGLPKSLIEAGACGRPMIASDVPGCREVVRHRKTGLLVPVDDPVALADAIAELSRSPELRARYGAAARDDVEQRFGSARIAAETVALYKALLSARR